MSLCCARTKESVKADQRWTPLAAFVVQYAVFELLTHLQALAMS